MKKFLILLIAFCVLAGCKSVPETKTKVELPPMPEHVDFPPVTSVQDMAKTIVQQDAIIKSWEAWGNNVKGIIGE